MKKLFISQRAVSAYEKGQRQMPLELLPMIADLFDVSLDYLFGRTDF